jgi:hypothetical protein
MTPTIPKVKLSLQETNSGIAGLVVSATLAKKRQNFLEMEVYKISNNWSLPYCSRASRAAARVAKEGAGDRAAGSPVPAAILSQYDLSDNKAGDEDANGNGVDIRRLTKTTALTRRSWSRRAQGPAPTARNMPDPRRTGRPPRPTPPTGRLRLTRPRMLRSGKTAALVRAGTGSATAWLSSKPPWPCPDQWPLILRNKHKPARPPRKRWPPSTRRYAARSWTTRPEPLGQPLGRRPRSGPTWPCSTLGASSW